MANGAITPLSVMQSLIGTEWEKGDGPKPIIISWLKYIGQQYPPMSSYCNSAATLDYFEWCGLAVGYCMAKSNIKPVFVSPTMETDDFLWAYAWLNWGQIKSTPSPGDVVVFNWGGGNAHVTLFESDLGNGYWTCLGGNQSNAVKRSNFPKSCVVGVRAAPAAIAMVAVRDWALGARDGVEAAPLDSSADARFKLCVGHVLSDEGGNVDNPRDPRGRTSRGITQSDWTKWIQVHPGLPSDVFAAPQDQIEAIYRAWYWNIINGDKLPAGIDYAMFDYGVLSGVGRAARSLQGLVGVTQDGDVGSQTIAAVNKADPVELVNQVCDDRLQYMQGNPVWSIYGAGWTARVNCVKTRALAMISGSAGQPESFPSTAAPTYKRVAQTVSPKSANRAVWLEAGPSGLPGSSVQHANARAAAIAAEGQPHSGIRNLRSRGDRLLYC